MDKIKKSLSYAFSDSDIRLYLPNIPIMEYHDLAKYPTIKDLLPAQTCSVIILIETSEKRGHWCSLSRRGNTLIWFDSYGLDVDAEFRYIPIKIQITLHESKRYLTKLIDNSDFECEYNGYQLQSKKSFVSTCARFVILWLLKFNEGMDLLDFYKYLDFLAESLNFKGSLKYDLVVLNQIPFSGN
jgi:hypothetical protein